MTEDEALETKRLEIASKQPALVGMTPVSSILRWRLDQMRPKESDAKPTRPDLPKPPAWLRRRFFCTQSADGRKTAVWVDDSCDGQHVPYEYPDGTHLGWKLWHSYQDVNGRAFAIRCPASLTNEESARLLADEPFGHWRNALRDYVRPKGGARAVEPTDSLD